MPNKHLIVLTYDIAQPRRLRRVAKASERYGRRIQKSVFELHIDARNFAALRSELVRLVDPDEDSIRFYELCARCTQTIHWLGLGETPQETRSIVL